MKRKHTPPKFSRRHAGVLLFLLNNPGMRQKEAAKQLGYSEKWLSAIVNSPEFRAQWTLTFDSLTEMSIRKLYRNSH